MYYRTYIVVELNKVQQILITSKYLHVSIVTHTLIRVFIKQDLEQENVGKITFFRDTNHTLMIVSKAGE